MTKRRTRRTFTPEFKNQMVQLSQNGKSKSDLLREYNLTSSALDRWISQANKAGSFKEKDNRTDAENELIELHKKVKQLEMENDILKQAALIMGRK